MTDNEYILQHRHDDVHQLALRPSPADIDIKWCLQQIEGWQLACRKLPRWATVEGLWYPPHLAMEQCSGEESAAYKRRLAERLLPSKEHRHSMIDLTGGYGVDFSYLGQAFDEPVYVERQENLCNIARHNFPLLKLKHARIVCEETQVHSPFLQNGYDLIYVDPARRDNDGHKTIAVEDCTPDLSKLQEQLLAKSHCVMVKLSPMLDITQALRTLHHVGEVHVISVHGECKELLLVMSGETTGEPVFHCVNLGTADPPCSCRRSSIPAPACAGDPATYLYEPNASILKANVQDILAGGMAISKLHPMSNLFTSDTLHTDFPGRIFRIEAWSHPNKRESRKLLTGIQQANITIRNFPGSVAQLRRQLNLREGGNIYLFATTIADGSHALIRCRKIAREN